MTAERRASARRRERDVRRAASSLPWAKPARAAGMRVDRSIGFVPMAARESASGAITSTRLPRLRASSRVAGVKLQTTWELLGLGYNPMAIKAMKAAALVREGRDREGSRSRRGDFRRDRTGFCPRPAARWSAPNHSPECSRFGQEASVHDARRDRGTLVAAATRGPILAEGVGCRAKNCPLPPSCCRLENPTSAPRCAHATARGTAYSGRGRAGRVPRAPRPGSGCDLG